MFKLSLAAAGLAVAGLVATSCLPTAAQDYPTKPVRILTQFAPGGGVEVTLRVLAQKLTESGWPQVVVDNRPGGGGTLAAVATVRAQPDGYTLLLADIGSHAVAATLQDNLPYDPVRDFKPITLLWSFPSTLAVPTSSRAHSVSELLALAKSQPDGLSYASQGPGSGGHLLGAMFAKAAGIASTHVPYRGAGPAIVDLVGGRVDLMFASYATVKSQVDHGDLRILAVTSRQRLGELPGVPTMTEAGFPDVFLDAWFGLVGPAKLPDPVATMIRERVIAIMQEPAMAQKLAEQGWRVTVSTPEEFRELIATEVVRLGRVLQRFGSN
jgi:tripartite-type tricarboxylate transporter receptor subunit TctC